MAAETDAALFREYAGELADQYQLPRDFVQAVFAKESSYRPDAVSPAGALGIAQLMPDVAKARGVDPLKPVQALETGVQILAENYRRFGGDLVKTYAGYNSNPDKVEERLARGFTGLPAETQAAVEWLAERSPSMQKQLGLGEEPAQASPRMPLMSDALDPVDRTPRDKAVDIPDTSALVYSDMAQQRDFQPLPSRLASLALDPLAELGIAGTRAATGSSIPAPPVDRLAGDVLQAATMLPGLNLGRLGSAALLAGGGAAAGMQQAAERHATTGADLQKQFAAMDKADAVAIGFNTVFGGVVGAALPTKAVRVTSPEGALARGRQDLGAMMARETADMALPPPRSAEVTAAFNRIDKAASVDATDWMNVLLRWKDEGKAIPSEVQAVARKLQPQMRAQAVVPGLPPVVSPSGAFRATVGDLLDANRALGAMVNTKAGRLAATAAGHNADNLTALRGALSDAIESALPNGRQLLLYRAARETSKEVAQHNAGMRLLEKYLNPTEGVANGAGLYKAIAGGQREQMIKTMGLANYERLREFATAIKGVTSESGSWLAAALQPAFSPTLTNAAMATGGFYAGGPQGAAAALGARVLYGLATSRPIRALVDEVARYGPRSQRGLAAVGRLTVAARAMREDLERDLTPAPSLPIDQPMRGAQPVPVAP